MESLFNDFYSNQQSQNSNLKKDKEILVTFAEYKKIKGCPILIDDATNSNLKYLKEVVKDDYFLISSKITDHVTFIFTSNNAEQIKQEISKRVVVFTINNQLNEDTAIRRDASLAKLQKNMHNALYRFYIAQIFPEILKLVDEINNSKIKIKIGYLIFLKLPLKRL